MADIAELGLKWSIQQAKDGQRDDLAKQIRRWKGPMPPELLNFVAGVVDGSIKLKRPKKRKAFSRYAKERNVAYLVNMMMGKKRDKNLRTLLTRQACELPMCETTPERVASYLKHQRR